MQRLNTQSKTSFLLETFTVNKQNLPKYKICVADLQVYNQNYRKYEQLETW